MIKEGVCLGKRYDGTEKKIISRYISDADKYLEVDSYGK